MAKHVIDHKVTKAWQLNASGDTWLVAKNGEIDFYAAALDIASGIFEGSAYKNNLIDVAGDISVTEATHTIGVYSQGKSVDIILRASASIDATRAVRTEGLQASIDNHADLKVWGEGVEMMGDQSVARNFGSIDAYTPMIAYGADSKLFNQGKIHGMNGVTLQGEGGAFTNSGKVDGDLSAVLMWSGGKVVNQATGVLTGNSTIYIDTDGGEMTLANKGVIAGGTYAVLSKSSTEDHVVNSGVIVGTVSLGAGDDSFNNAKGSFHGEVRGGAGNDIYVAGDAALKYVELADEGIDTVKSSITAMIGANVECLTLTGKLAASGTGNELGNTIVGNAAANNLSGQGGGDGLQGGAGDDYLAGGDGVDRFIFKKGSDHDTIADFNPAGAAVKDLIVLDHIDGIDAFDDLEGKMTDNMEGGVDIDLGGGDVITIDNYTVDKLSASDFWIMSA
jgi:Ca2+-binding RTX toxin-like protein